MGAGAVVRWVGRLVAVAVQPARDRAAAGAGDARDDRGGAVPPLPQPAVRRPARALPRAGVAGTHGLGTRAVPGRGAAPPLGRDLPGGAVPAQAVRCPVRRLRAAGASLAVNATDLQQTAGGHPEPPPAGRRTYRHSPPLCRARWRVTTARVPRTGSGAASLGSASSTTSVHQAERRTDPALLLNAAAGRRAAGRSRLIGLSVRLRAACRSALACRALANHALADRA